MPADVNYVIAQALNQGATSRSSVVKSSNLSTCTTLYSKIEIWQDGQWYEIRDESNNRLSPCTQNSPCTSAAPYSWLKTYTVSAGTASIVVDTNDFNSYDGTDKLQSEYHLRVITRDRWSRHASNPVSQAFSVTINYQCQDDTFRYKSGKTSLGLQ